MREEIREGEKPGVCMSSSSFANWDRVVINRYFPEDRRVTGWLRERSC